MCDAEKLRNCDVEGCFAIAVGYGDDGRQLCDPHYLARQVPHVRMWRGRNWRDADPIPVRDLALIGVLRVMHPARDYPPGHYYAKCDNRDCNRTCVIGPDEYPYPVCDKCDERYERRRRAND